MHRAAKSFFCARSRPIQQGSPAKSLICSALSAQRSQARMSIQLVSPLTQTFRRLVRKLFSADGMISALRAAPSMSSRRTLTSQFGLAFAQLASTKGSSASSML
jgi:hypothetical protein